MIQHIPASIRALSRRVKAAGGSAFLVGGAVIDLVRGRAPKDWDLEVFRLTFTDLERIFADLKPETVGRAFGVLKLTVDGLDVDVNIPRTDNKVGVGHQGFDVTVDPHMTPEEAGRRRDFTINSMSFNLETGELVDPFGGLTDLHSGVLRVTDSTLFVQDPLRALRAMQLLARKARTVAPDTMRLIRDMSHTFPELPRERVFEEFRKLFLKAEKPSVGLAFLKESGWLVHFPEIEALIGCPQREEWHPEGDVWTHSLLAADAMAEVRDFVPEHQREAFAFGVFLHDVGKPKMTITQDMIDRRDPRVLDAAEKSGCAVEDMLLTAHGHDVEGMDPAESFMRRVTDSVKTIKLVRGIVGMHMRPWALSAGDAKKGAFARLHRQMQEAGGDLTLIGRVCQCDACATGTDWKTRSLRSGTPNWEHETSQRVMSFAEDFASKPKDIEPKVMGRDLLALGMKPGPDFGRILRAALDLQDSDASLTKEEIISKVLPVRV